MFWRRRKRLDEEVQSHLAEEAADNIARGMDPVKARNLPFLVRRRGERASQGDSHGCATDVLRWLVRDGHFMPPVS
jgi:hypothetical protein